MVDSKNGSVVGVAEAGMPYVPNLGGIVSGQDLNGFLKQNSIRMKVNGSLNHENKTAEHTDRGIEYFIERGVNKILRLNELERFAEADREKERMISLYMERGLSLKKAAEQYERNLKFLKEKDYF